MNTRPGQVVNPILTWDNFCSSNRVCTSVTLHLSFTLLIVLERSACFDEQIFGEQIFSGFPGLTIGSNCFNWGWKLVLGFHARVTKHGYIIR